MNNARRRDPTRNAICVYSASIYPARTCTAHSTGTNMSLNNNACDLFTSSQATVAVICTYTRMYYIIHLSELHPYRVSNYWSNAITINVTRGCNACISRNIFICKLI